MIDYSEDELEELRREFPPEPPRTVRYWDREIGCYVEEELEDDE